MSQRISQQAVYRLCPRLAEHLVPLGTVASGRRSGMGRSPYAAKPTPDQRRNLPECLSRLWRAGFTGIDHGDSGHQQLESGRSQHAVYACYQTINLQLQG